MNSTADIQAKPIWWLICLAVAALPAVAQSGTDADPQSQPHLTPIHQALNLLQASEYELAEAMAVQIANQDPSQAPRAWLVAATARRQMGNNAQAVHAYRKYLETQPKGPMASYARQQLDLAGQASKPGNSSNTPPSSTLSDKDRAQMAIVEDRVHVETSDRFVVRARNAKLARLVVKQAQRSLERVCNDLLNGIEFNYSVDVYVWTDRKEYLKNATDAPEWSGGSYSITNNGNAINRRIDLTQLDSAGDLSMKMLDRILPHELAHLVVRELFGGGECPLVVNEGLAMMAEYEIDNERLRLAGTALAGKKRLSMGRLLTSQWHNLQNPDVFYAEAYSLMEFVYTRLDRSQQKQLLEHMQSGSAFTDALQQALALPHDEQFAKRLETAWQDHAIAQAQFLHALDEGFGARK